LFVKSSSGKMATLGVGKLLSRHRDYCLVEYFDTPTVKPSVYKVERVETVKLGTHTRVYLFDTIDQTWKTGNILSEKHGVYSIILNNGDLAQLNAEDFFVRWRKPITDPTQFLSNWLGGVQEFSDSRSRFVQSQIEQRAASCGISSLLSSAIKLEPYQFEVVRRVLQDPVQRYLLADEVGLGKTIEAGVLIRQCVLDSRGDCTILLIVPSSLKVQWKRELSDRFFLGEYLERSIFVVDVNDGDKINKLLPILSMLVIDEAHHLNAYLNNGVDSLYEKIAKAAKRIERILLISATPALHNERSFLEMLHLLDPLTYDLNDEMAFRDRVNGRQKLAEIVAGLVPENLYYLDYSLDELESLFPSDKILLEITSGLREILMLFPEVTDVNYLELLSRLRVHISETYRLNRRILRHRRKNVIGATPVRSGASIVSYRSIQRASLRDSLEHWRFQEAVSLDANYSDAKHTKRSRVFWQTLEKAFECTISGAGILEYLARQTDSTGNARNFSSIIESMKQPEHFLARSQALVNAIAPYLKQGIKCVVFCSDKLTADRLATEIRNKLRVEVDRHNSGEDSWRLFLNVKSHSVLVCDRRGEEGLNLQGGRKVVVHYDMPLNPNRIEQRMGRVDRFGSTEAIHSLVLMCEDDPYEVAWVDYVNSALKVFDRSIASLQYLIEESVSAARTSSFTDGIDGIVALKDRGIGEDGLIEREIRAIDQQDDLDALGAPSLDAFHRLAEVDSNWRAISVASTNWFEDFLQLSRSSLPETGRDLQLSSPFRFNITSHSLISHADFLAFCGSALDPTDPRGSRTIPYTFCRETALDPVNRAEGVGLLRYGDALVSGISRFTQASDQGRSFATWRFHPDYSRDSVADIYFKVNFIIEADISSSRELIGKLGYKVAPAIEAVRRRGDMALPPTYRTIWLDRELREVKDVDIIRLLQLEYREQQDYKGSFDVNVTGRHLVALKRIDLPELEYWPDYCMNARKSAEAMLRSSLDFSSLRREAMRAGANSGETRLSQLRARLSSLADSAIAAEYENEDKLAAAIGSGIREPKVILDTIGVTFLSGDPVTTDKIKSGCD
jgi:ATP-dependent helicase HepA